jgi:hypothetical protein
MDSTSGTIPPKPFPVGLARPGKLYPFGLEKRLLFRPALGFSDGDGPEGIYHPVPRKT